MGARLPFVAALGVLCLVGCTSDPTLPGRSAHVVASSRFGLANSNGVHVSELRYTAATVDVAAVAVRGQLRQVSADGADYTFRSAVGPLASLAPGRVMLLEGTALRRVIGVRTVGGAVVVHTGPAALTDAVAAGDLTWRTPVDFGAGLRSGAGTGISRGYRYVATLTPRGRQLGVDLRVRQVSPLAVDLHVRGSLDRLTSTGHIVIARGRLRTATLGTADTSGQFSSTYSARAAAALSSGGEQSLAIPVGYRVPIVVGGLPFSVRVSTSLALAVGFGRLGLAVSGTSSVSYAGSAGIRVTGAGATSADSHFFGTGAQSGHGSDAIDGALGVVLATAVPRLDLGIGVYGASDAASLELTSTTSVRATGAGMVCAARAVRITGTEGVSAGAFGLPGVPAPVSVLDARNDTAVPAGCGTVGGR